MFDRSVVEFDRSETSISEGHAKVKKCITICVFDIITQCTNFSKTFNSAVPFLSNFSHFFVNGFSVYKNKIPDFYLQSG